MATTSVTTAGLNLLSGGGFELNWVIRGTEWSNGSIPSGWQAISTHVASGSGSSGSAASDLVAIQRQVNSQADQAYALRMQFPGALPKGAELRVEWAGEEVARFDSASIGSYQSHTLMLPGIDGGALLKLITNRGVAFGSINGLGLWAQPDGARPLSLPATAKVGQSLVANTDSIADVDGLGDFNYQWQRKDDATQKWVNVDGGTQKTLKLNQDLVGSQLRVEVGYVDEDGFQEVLVSQATEDIQHANRAPSAGGIKQLASGQEDQSVLITAADLLAGSSDLDGDNLSLRRVRLTSGQGSLSRVDTSTWRYTPRDNWFGEVNLSYQISDGKAIAKASASLLIEPVNDAPTASTVTLSAIEEDSVALISEADLLATANDIDGDVLSVDGLEVLEGDGSLSQNADGSWSFTPNGNWNGAVRLGYSVNDGNGGSVQVAAKLTIDPVNDAPELTGEMAVLADGREDRAMTIQAADLLQGFTDPDGDPLQVINLRVSEGEGSLQAGESGSWVFTPGKDWSGTVTLDYQVSDGELIWRNAAVGGSPEQFDGTDFESAPWNFTGQGGVYLEEVDGWTPPEGELIEVKNNGDGSGQAANGEQFIELNQDPLGFFPNASGVFKDITTNAGQEYELSLQYAGRAGYDEDVNRFEVLIDGVSQGTWSQSNTTATPGDSSLGGEHNWETINLKFTASGPATRVELKEAGSDLPFGRGMRIDDIRIASIGTKVPADTAQQSFVVIPGNDVPELTGTPVVLEDGQEDVAYTIAAADLLQGYTDADGDSLSVDGLSSSVGSLSDNNDGTWTLSTPQDFNGQVELSYAVIDGEGGSADGSKTFQLTPVNDAPVVSGPVDLGETLEDGTFRITTEQLLANASDVDGDELAVRDLKLSSGQGSITNNGDGSWSFVPSENWNGETEFTYGVSDISNSDSQTQLSDSEILAATWGSDEGIGILDTETNNFTQITSASYQGMLGDEVIANRKDGKEAFIRQSDGIKGISIETGEERILHIESSALIGYNKNEDSLVTYNFVSDEISETNLTTLETTTKAASVLQGASVQAGGFAGFSPETNTATLLTRSWDGQPQSVLTSINLNTGEKSQVTAEGLGGNLQAISSKVTADSIFGVWQDEKAKGFLQIGRINTKTGAVTAHAELETGLSGGFSNYNFDVNEAGIAFVHHSGEKDGEWGSWITSVDTKDGRILGSVNNPGDILRGNLTDIANPSVTAAGANLTVNPVNDAPTVSSDVSLGSVDEDNSFSFTAAQLLANASDVDGDTLSVINLSVDSAQGSITDHGDGSFTFNPNKDFNGDVRFSFDVSDGQGSSDPWNGTISATAAGANLTVNPVNDAPTVSSDVSLGSVDEDNSFSFTAAQLLANASDVDGDTLSVINLSVDSAQGSITDHGDGSFTFNPNKDFNGDVRFSFDVSDGQGSSDPWNGTISATAAGANLTINPVNDAPTVSSDVSLGSVDEDNSFSFTAAQLLANASDVDGDTLSVINLSVDSAQGSITDHGDGSFTFNPNKDFNGDVRFSFDVSDGQGSSDPWNGTISATAAGANLTVNPVNDAPTVSSDVSLGSVDEDNSFSFTAAQLLANASDVDGDTLSVINLSVDSAQGSITDHGDGSFTFNPNKDFNGDVRFSFDVSDGQGSSDPWNGTISATAAGANLTINPVNDAPTVSSDVSLGSVDEDNSFSFTAAQLLANASDVDGDTLSVINLSVDSAQGSITDHGDGSFTFNPNKDFNGQVAFSYEVSDGKTVVKNPVPTPPIGEPTPPVSPQPPSGDPRAIVTPASLQIDEAGTLQAQIQVNGMAAGSTVFWSLRGEHINGSDFANGQTEGSATLKADGSFSLNQALNADRFSEGIERFQIQVFSDAERSSQLGQSSEIVILDSSTMEHRAINGAGNNLANALLNSANSTFQRIGPADFADGVHAMHPDSEVTNARTVSNEVIAGDGTQANSQGISAMLYAWGQFIDHDITQMANSDVRDPNNSINIQVPEGDAFLNGEIRVTRRGIASGTGVDGKPAEVLNAVTGWLDASMVYGSDPATAARLRGQNGLMRVSDGDNLPIANFGRGPQFDAGDNRAAENPNLTALQTLFIREHNRLVGNLSQQHPEWSSDELYEHARAIVGTEIAQITYNEFLPKLIGTNAISDYQGHDSGVDARLSVEFSGAAYRFGHSLVSSELQRLDNDGNTIGSALNLRDAFFMNPQLFVQDGGADAFLRNLASDLSKELDVHIADDLRNFLSVGPGMPSMDLAAINIQRGRDLGLGSLNETRQSLGLSTYSSFAEITSDADAAAALERAYGSVDEVELWVGGLAEDHFNGGMVGETFQRIIADQFTALRDGDRLWFENEMFDSETLNQIKGTSLADLIRNNTDTAVIQDDVFAAINRAELIAQVGPEALQQQGEVQGPLSPGAQEQPDSVLFNNADSAQGTGEVVAAVAAAKAHLTVNPVNDAPTVSGDVSLGSVDEDNSFSFTTADLLKNASDVDGDPLSVVDLRVTSENGSLATNADESFTFTPDANFNGEVSFSFGVSDGHGAADPWTGAISSTPAGASLTVNPVNDAPEVSRPADLGSVDEDNVFTFTAADLLQNAFDVDGDQLTVVDLKLTSNDGTLSTNPDGSFSFTPNTNFNGQVSLSFGVSDGQGSSDPWTGTLSSTAAEAFFTVNPVNDAPELTGVIASLANGQEDSAYTINSADLLQGYSDVDGDTLFVTGLTASVGTLANNNDGTWTLTAPQDFNGKVDLSYSVSDGNGASTAGSHSFSLTPVNDAPVVSGAVNLGEMLEDGTFRITSEQLLANASDVDGDTLSVVDLKLASGQGSISDNGDGSWTFSPDANWNGPVSFSYGVSDGKKAFFKEDEFTQIVGNLGAFAAIRTDGSVITWGEGGAGGGGSQGYPGVGNPDVSDQLTSGVIKVFSTNSAFAALKEDGSVVTWGGDYRPDGSYARYGDAGGNSSSVSDQISSGVKQIFSTLGAFAALKEDGSVITWGEGGAGGGGSQDHPGAGNPDVSDQLTSGVIKVFSTNSAFAALKEDGSVVTWGGDYRPDGSYARYGDAGGNSSSVSDQISSGVKQIYSTLGAFAALKEDGSVITWGEGGAGGGGSQDHPGVGNPDVSDQLTSGVIKVFSTNSAFAALKEDGSVVTWGGDYRPDGSYARYGDAGGNSSSVSDQISSGVKQIFSTLGAFAALKEDGSVITWGEGGAGGGGSQGYPGVGNPDVSDQLTSGVTKVFSTNSAFAALKEDGSVVTWGGDYRPDGSYARYGDAGGNSSSVSDQISSGVKQIFSTLGAFAALKEDGSVITWGEGGAGGGGSQDHPGVGNPDVSDQLTSGVTKVFSTNSAFAALKEDGSVVTWGGDYRPDGSYARYGDAGGNSTSVDLDGPENNLSIRPIAPGTDWAKAIASLDVTPVNDTPVASDITLYAIDEDNSVVIKESELLSTASDIDGDTLSVKDLKVAEGQGALADNGDGTFTFTPGKNWNGQVELAYSVDDGHGASASVSANLTVNPVNDAPLLTGLMAKLGLGKEDHSFTIKASDLLAGFSDPDGDALSVANLRVADGQGTLSAGDAGTWTFTPDANWNGTVALEYQVTDGQLVWQSEGGSQGGSTIEHADFEGNGWSLTGDGAAFVSSADGWQSPTQQIELKNNLDQQGTAASGEQFIELNEDPIDFFPDSPSIFKEIETVAGQSYNFSLQYAGRPGFDESVNRFEVLIDGISQGTWSQNNSVSDHLWETLNLSFDASSSSTRIEIREAGDDEAFGRGMRIDDIRISTQGSGAASDTVRQTFEIAPVNDAPELTGAKAALADGTEDVAYTINSADLLQGYTDVDGDTLSVTGLTASVGDLTNNNDGTWTLTAPQDFNGKVDLSYSVSDGNGAFTAGSQSFSLTPVNDAPVISGAVNLGEMLEDGTFLITSEQLLANASDVDGDTLSVVGLKLASGQGSITDNGDGSWTFSPDVNWHGDVSFFYGVSDGQTTTLNNLRDDLVIRGNSLYVVVNGESWTEAESSAHKLGGNLTAITSQEEAIFISDKIYKEPEEQYANAHFFIGLNDKDNEGDYKWSSGEIVEFTNFAKAPAFDMASSHNIKNDYFVVYAGKNGIQDWINTDNAHSFYDSYGVPNFGIAEIPFIQRGNSAYIVVEGLTWEHAEANAQKLGGNLASINDENENQWIESTFIDSFQTNFFIGATDKNLEGSWEWTNGDSFSYSNWYRNEPNNADGGEDFSVISGAPQDGDRKGFWNDTKGVSPELGIAEIKLGSDFGVSGSANLSVSSVNDVATGEPVIEVIGDPADEISPELADLGFSHVSGDSAALDQSGSNPTGLIPDGEILAGSVWDDSLIGSDANDVLIGSITGASDEQWDVLTGGGGGDLFVLGNKNGSFYSSGGMADYAQITDFDPTQDQLQLHGGSNYAMAQVNHPDVIGTGIFNDLNSDGLVGEGDDLIAVIANQDQPVEIQRDNLKFV